MGIALGVLADAVIGDPRRAHPVAGFGRWAGVLERRAYGPSRARGVLFLGAATAAPVALGWLTERGTRGRPVLRTAVTAAATWAALGGTSLAREGTAMAQALEAGDVGAARRRLPHLCARDPAGLGPDELARAAVESLAENTSDAVVAPLLWAAVGGVPGVVGYRAVNTLDAMVGYTSPRYLRFGWASARLDDVVNLLPARVTGLLTVACARTVGGSVRRSWRILIRDGGHHPSPNAGRCEAAAAGALGVRLGGANSYGGRVERRPELGEGPPPAVTDIRRAVRLGRAVGLAAAGLAVLVALGKGRGRR